MEEKKNKSQFNLMSTKEHKGFGAGALDLSTLSSLIIDNEEAYIDLGAIHAKSKVERGIKFSTNREDCPNGRRCWIVWVVVGRNEDKANYAGLTTCEMLIDAEEKKGFKRLVDHVNRMESALKHRYLVDDILTDVEKQAIRNLLIQNNPQYWEQTPQELKSQLGV